MAYLRLNDYNRAMLLTDLNQLIGNDQTIRLQDELASLDEVKSYLQHKYDVAVEFTDTPVYNILSVYKANNRVELNFPLYDPAGTVYVINALVINSGQAYSAKTAGLTGVFVPSSWNLIGNQYDLFYGAMPQLPFDNTRYYLINDKVFLKDKVYTCKIATSVLDHDTALQYRDYFDLPVVNVFPDDISAGLQYWGVGVAYSIPAGTPVTNATFWTPGDNRSQKIVEIMVDVTLYKIHKRIPMRNIPTNRAESYTMAKEWLLNCAREDTITPNIPRLSPKKGGRIRYGGDVKKVNSY
jgi:hypothetical protein